MIKRTKAEIVTLNEICKGDLPAMVDTVRAEWPNSYSVSTFLPLTEANDAAITCKTGTAYGIAVITAVSADKYKGWSAYGKAFKAQDGDAERRGWVCAEAKGSYFACATQFAADKPRVALSQCLELIDNVIPSTQGHKSLPWVIGGVLNLQADGKTSLSDCTGDDYVHTGSDVQHVIASSSRTLEDTTTYEMHGTEFPALATWISGTWN